MGTRHHDTGNIQSCGATIGQGDGPRRAGRAYGLTIERNGRATDRDAGCQDRRGRDRAAPSSTGSEQKNRNDTRAHENRGVRAAPWMHSRSHKSEVDLEQVQSLRGALHFPCGTPILKHIDSQVARRISPFRATHPFVAKLIQLSMIILKLTLVMIAEFWLGWKV